MSTITYDGIPLNATTANATPNSVATSSTGLWDTASVGTQGAWVDIEGGVWNNIAGGAAGHFVGTSTGATDYNTAYALRPSGENSLNQYITGYFDGLTGNNGLVLRYQSPGNLYLASVTSIGNVFLYAVTGGNRVSLLPGGDSFTITPGDSYSVQLTVTANSPTTISIVITDITLSVVVYMHTVTNSASALQVAGRSGMVVWSSASQYTRVQTGVPGGGSGALTAGVLAASFSDPSGVVLNETSISGGTAPYSTQFYRSPTSGFVPPSAGTPIGSPTAAIAPAFTDTTGTPGQVYYYKAYTTDSASGNATSNQIAASQQRSNIRLGLMGDSLLDPAEGVGQEYPFWTNVSTQLALQAIAGVRTVNVTDAAVSGTDSGTWIDFFAQAFDAFVAANVEIIMIQLGTNDVRTPASTYSPGERPLGTWNDGTTAGDNGSYAKNIWTLVNNFITAGFKVMVSYVPYFYPTSSFNGVVWNDASLNLAQTYNIFIPTLANNVTMFGANAPKVSTAVISTFEYFANNQSLYFHENSTSGVHPNQPGVDAYGAIHAINLATALGLVGGGSGAGNLTAQQALSALAVLTHTAQPPFLNQNATGMYIKNNQLVIPQSSGNIALGSALFNTTDSNNIYLGLVPGDPSSGY